MPAKPMPRFMQSDIDRFWSYVDRTDEGRCWHWKASQFTGGYGQFKVNGQNLKSHRVAYFLHYGVDPLDELVCHACDNPPCCNPHHLFLGDNSVNIQDSKQKGRLNTARGENHGSKRHPERFARGERVAGAKLTAEQVTEIRKLYAEGEMTEQELADTFGVSRNTINHALRGKTWRHLDGWNPFASLLHPERRWRRGAEHGMSKLTEDDVRAIRAALANGTESVSQLAAKFGVTVGMIRHIAKGRSWKDLP